MDDEFEELDLELQQVGFDDAMEKLAGTKKPQVQREQKQQVRLDDGQANLARAAATNASSPPAAKKYKFNRERKRWATEVDLHRSSENPPAEAEPNGGTQNPVVPGRAQAESEEPPPLLPQQQGPRIRGASRSPSPGAFDEFLDAYRPPVKFASQQRGIDEQSSLAEWLGIASAVGDSGLSPDRFADGSGGGASLGFAGPVDDSAQGVGAGRGSGWDIGVGCVRTMHHTDEEADGIVAEQDPAKRALEVQQHVGARNVEKIFVINGNGHRSSCGGGGARTDSSGTRSVDFVTDDAFDDDLDIDQSADDDLIVENPLAFGAGGYDGSSIGSVLGMPAAFDAEHATGLSLSELQARKVAVADPSAAESGGARRRRKKLGGRLQQTVQQEVRQAAKAAAEATSGEAAADEAAAESEAENEV